MAITDEELQDAMIAMSQIDDIALAGMNPLEQERWIGVMTHFLSEYRALPAESQSTDTELTIMDRLAVFLSVSKYYYQAIPLLQEIIQKRQSALPLDEPLIAMSLCNLAGVYLDCKRFADARPVCEEAVRIARASLPPGHTRIADCLNNLAGAYKGLNRYEETDAFFSEALLIYRGALPPDDSKIALTLNNLAGLYEHQLRLAEAESLYLESLQTLQKNLGDTHPATRNSANNLQRVRQLMRRSVENQPKADDT